MQKVSVVFHSRLLGFEPLAVITSGLTQKPSTLGYVLKGYWWRVLMCSDVSYRPKPDDDQKGETGCLNVTFSDSVSSYVVLCNSSTRFKPIA